MSARSSSQRIVEQLVAKSDDLGATLPPATMDVDSITRSIVTRETRLRTGQASELGSSDEGRRALDGDERTLSGGRADAGQMGHDPARMGQIGRFVVLRRLGAGGMGVVYLAYDNALDRRVAVKLIRSVAAPDPVQIARMRREAQAMARLSHPNVLQIYEAGESEGSLFLAMEYVHGGSLGQWLSGHVSMDRPIAPPPRDWRAIVAMFIQAGRGLAAAHQAGLVHRDFKPDNVLVGEDGIARVADFGLVRVVEAEPAGPAVSGASGHAPVDSLTVTRSVMGTPAYMSPEQHAGLPTDARTDQFSFCVALWEALYGERPFAGGTLEELARTVGRGEPVALPAGSGVPTWLRSALLRGLAVDPADRWPSMQALLGVLTSNPAARRRRRLMAAGASVLVAGAVGLLGYATLAGRQRADVATQRADVATQRAAVASDERDRALAAATREAVRARDTLRMASLREIDHDPTSVALILQEVEDPGRTPEWTQSALATLATPLSAAVLRGHSNGVTAAEFIGDDDELVVTSAVDRTARVWRRDGTGDPQVLPHADPVNGVVVSPDRQRFVTLGEPTARLWQVGAPGAPVTELGGFRGGEARSELAAFTADGRRLATTDRQGTVRLWEVDSGRLLAQLGNHGDRVFAIGFDADGRRLATGDGDGGLFLWRMDGGTHDKLTGLGDLVSAVHMGADGQLMATSARKAQVWSAAGEPRFALRGHTGEITGGAASPDGREYATASKDGTVRLWDAATGTERLRLEHRGEVEQVVYSPDARWLATISDERINLWRRDNRHIVHALDGDPPNGVVFSRDSAHLLSHASSEQTARVWDLRGLADGMVFRAPREGVKRVFGGCDLGQVLAFGKDGTLRSWDCSDGRPVAERRLSTLQILDIEIDAALTRAAYLDEKGGVWVTSLVEGQPRKLGVHPRLGWRVGFSPDGRHLISTGYDRTAHIWDLVGAAPPVVLMGHTSPVVWDAAWSPDGATIATIANDTSVRIWSVGSALADSRRGPTVLQASQVFTGHKRGAKTVAFSPDGTRVLTSSPDSTARIWDPLGVAAPVVLEGHRGELYAAAWSPDGARIATSSEDGTARIWRVDGAAPPLVLRGHRAGIPTVEWHPKGRAVVTASVDGTARVWDAERGVAVDIYTANQAVHEAHFTRDGVHVLVVVGDDTARLWRPGQDLHPDPAALMTRLRAATTGCLTARERELVLLEPTEQAWARHAACEARHGRTPDVNEGIEHGPPGGPAGVSRSKGG